MKDKGQGLVVSKFISPGCKIELETIEEIADGEGNSKKRKYDSRVMDVLDEDNLEILMPMIQTKLVLLPLNGQYDIHFATGKGFFQCRGKVVERYKSDNVYLLQIELISGLERYQRREYFRYNCTIDMETRLLNENENNFLLNDKEFEFEELPTQHSTILDISGGGIRFISNADYPPETNLFCNFKLGNEPYGRYFKLICRILNKKPVENQKDTYEYRLIFVNVDNKEREEIIRIIFQEERRNRQR